MRSTPRLNSNAVLPPVGLVVFDLDGTLVDSSRDIADAANATLVSYGAAPLSEETIAGMVGDGAPTLVARVFAASAGVKPRDALARFLSIYHGRLLVHTRPYEGMVDVLWALSPRLPLAVLTNKPLDATHAILDGLDLARFFPHDRVIGGDGAFPRKPDPGGLMHLISACGVSAAETVLVGDSIVDWRTARAASTRSCGARYGFGWDTAYDGEREADPGWVIDRPNELLRHL